MFALAWFAGAGVVLLEAGSHLAGSPEVSVIAGIVYILLNAAVYWSLKAHDATVSDPVAVMGLASWPALLALGWSVAALPPFWLSIVHWGYPVWVVAAFIGAGLGGIQHSDTTSSQLSWAIFPFAAVLALRHRTARR